MKKLLFILLFTMTFTACNTNVKPKELKVLDNSKSSDVDMQKIVVQMKDELEKIKEQLLNIL